MSVPVNFNVKLFSLAFKYISIRGCPKSILLQIAEFLGGEGV